MSNFLKKIFEQEKPLNIVAIIFTIIGVSLVRTFLETFSSLDASEPFTSGYPAFTHFIYFYFSIILSLAIFLCYLTKVSAQKIISLMTTLFPVIWLPPIIDLLITRGRGWKIGYDILKPDEIIPAFFTFFGHLQDTGVTPGIRVEIFLILVGIFLFTYYHTRKVSFSLLGFLGGYCIFFIYAALPSLIATPWLLRNSEISSYLFYSSQFSQSWLATTHSLTSIPRDMQELFQQQTDIFMARLFWLGTILQAFFFFKLYSFPLWSAWKKNLRLERVLYYCFIGAGGMLLYQDFLNSKNLINLPNILALAIFFLLIALNAWFAVAINDEADIEIDKISNPDRPLVKKTMSVAEIRTIGFILFVFIISGVVLLNYVTFYLFLMFQFAYFIYSAYPLRLKRFIFFSSPLLGFNALTIAMAGFFLVSPDQHVSAFPKFALWFTLIGFAIIANIKDIKDFTGDRQEKIQTIPTIFGLKKGRLIIGIITAAFLLLFGLLSGNRYLFFATVPFAVFAFYLITLENFRELHLFYLFFAYAAMLFFI